jgi:hypothetical protein
MLTEGAQRRILAFMSERIPSKAEPENPDRSRARVEGGSSMVSKARVRAPKHAAKATRRAPTPELNQEEETILREALKYLLFKHGHLLVPARIREERDGGVRRWIITVHLRYPTGFEGEIGELLYDGAEFTFLTPPDVRRQRAQKIAEDPEAIRQWNELQASALPPGEE